MSSQRRFLLYADRNDGVCVIRTYCATEPGTYRLACFPHFTEYPSRYQRLSGQLLPGVEVLSFQYMGHLPDGTPAHIRDVVDLADQCLRELLDWTDLPLALIGHRGGAYLALLVAQRLEHRFGVTPSTLFVADRAAPSEAERREWRKPSCRIVALTGDASPSGHATAAAWRECTSGPFDLELFPGSRQFPYDDSSLVNLIHDQLLSLPNPALPLSAMRGD
ncbi:thioesterase II family protein [Streptomyces sp. NPDC059176]|uniref:thioesterase II family protein n=1 Tax=unclassified Streptomyces TaxID=2593676 RepID=UPI0036B30C0D